uniref:DUF1336 domain-containing protein n=1 Tax=Steinernema glaseri TaxID=37863 RepID=A0A1I7YE35_9BILA
MIFNIDNVVDQNRVCSQLPFLPPDCTGIGDFLFVVNPAALKKYRYVTIDGLIPWNSRDQKMCNRQFFYEVEDGPDGKPAKFTRKLSKQGANLLFRKICGSLPRDSRLMKRIFYAISLPKRKLAGFVLVAYSFTYPGPMPVQFFYEVEDGPDGKPAKFTRKLSKQGANLLFRKICGSLPRDSRLMKRVSDLLRHLPAEEETCRLRPCRLLVHLPRPHACPGVRERRPRVQPAPAARHAGPPEPAGRQRRRGGRR